MANRKVEGSEGPDAPDGDTATCRAGYSNPLRHGRFKPGQSGNPRGRPRGAKGRNQTVAKIANEMHWVIEDGDRRRRSTLELIVLQLRNLAAQGNVQAFRAYHTLLARYSPQATETRHGYMIVPEVLTIEEWQRLAVEVQAYQRRLEEEAEQ
jgi:Family of unknown function (DUF5681)